jgi:hypothetical protein
VGAGIRLWKERWLPWGLVTLVLAGVASVVLAIADPQPAIYDRTAWQDDPRDAVEGAVVVVGTLVGLVLGPWLYVILARGSLRATFEADGYGVIARTIRGVPSVLWIFVILFAGFIAASIPILMVGAAILAPVATEEEQAVFVLIAIAAFLVLFLWIVPRLILVVHTYVAEDRRGTRAIAEAWRHTRGAWWMTLGVLTLTLLVGLAISVIPTTIANTAFPDGTVAHALPRSVILALTNAVVTPISVAITTALYVELSARKGVLSQDALARNLARFDRRSAPPAGP